MVKEKLTSRLVLEDGTVYSGNPFGSVDELSFSGEVVFNTAMIGYEEALTDPSYKGQILVLTPTMVGNYGVVSRHYESKKIQCSGIIIRELSNSCSSVENAKGLSDWLKEEGIPGISGIDTRSLVRRLRGTGVLRGVISNNTTISDSDLVKQANALSKMEGQNLALKISSLKDTDKWDKSLDSWQNINKSLKSPRIALLDCGVKRNIIRHLEGRGCLVKILQPSASLEEILNAGPDGLLVSNGPGDPSAVTQTIETLRHLPKDYPVMGICLGHQLLALSLGASTYKLKFGHRGANQPVHNIILDRVEITSQNHGFCVNEPSLLDSGAIISHRHLNDGTVAGFFCPSRPLLSVQFHPEGAPGPHDCSYLFDWFMKMVETRNSLSEEEAHLVALRG